FNQYRFLKQTMPLFDYRCSSCNHSFSELKRIAEKDNTTICPECKSESTKRLITSFAVGSSGNTSHGPADCANAATCPSAASGFG
ncbi:zinc ribbon domain-containing protein, partial [bacterium]|nr:zinc ribbon domain-containing protein [bacterium]